MSYGGLTDAELLDMLNRTRSTQTLDDYKRSYIQWTIICTVSILCGFSIATCAYIRKATNWSARQKAKRLKKMQKEEEIEKQKSQLIKSKWETDAEILANFKKRLAENYFVYEFRNIQEMPPCGTTTYTGLKAFELAEKNKIVDVLPYDHNRVRLTQDPRVPCSQYINASYVNGYNLENFYVCIQGPFQTSVLDFWRVVWKERARCIVMLCEPFENAQRHCFRYWPDKSCTYGDLEVKVDDVVSTVDYTIRTFVITHPLQTQTLTVKQFQYRDWPQFGQPNVYSLLDFVRVVRAHNIGLHRVVVHSKTGSDRTGLYCAIDSCLEAFGADGKLSVHAICKGLRQCRMRMIRDYEQYLYIQETIRVFLLVGVTVVPLPWLAKFHKAMQTPGFLPEGYDANQSANAKKSRDQKLIRQSTSLKDRILGRGKSNAAAVSNKAAAPVLRSIWTKTNETGYEKQFKIANMLRHKLSQNECATGCMNEHRWLTRDPTCLPPDEARSYLMTSVSGAPDYINAVVCDAYAKATMFIITQWPLPNTVRDLWRMIFDYGIVSIVLTTDEEPGLRFPRFWPNKQGKKKCYDVIAVRLEKYTSHEWGEEYEYNISKDEGFVDMKSVLMKAGGESAAAVPRGEGRTASTWTVKFFRLRGWKIEDAMCDKSGSIPALIKHVDAWQKEAGREKFIVTISADGVKQVGVFLAVYMSWQRMTTELQVDILNAVLQIRRNRPQLLPTLSEYEYCWHLSVVLKNSDPLLCCLPDIHEQIPDICERGCRFCAVKELLEAMPKDAETLVTKAK